MEAFILSLLEMVSAIRVQIVGEAVCDSHGINSFVKGMNYLSQTGFDSVFFMEVVLRKGEIGHKPRQGPCWTMLVICSFGAMWERPSLVLRGQWFFAHSNLAGPKPGANRPRIYHRPSYPIQQECQTAQLKSWEPVLNQVGILGKGINPTILPPAIGK